jgi:aminomuconate-semialdehyde/2-hydroxymuconate-6-semialdehyde dehydrogenase
MQNLKNYIGGELVPPSTHSYLPNFSPATGSIYSNTPDSNEEDVNAAIEAAACAYPPWSALSSEARARYLRHIADAIRSRKEEFARAESLDTGKPLVTASNVDIARSIHNFEFFSEAATQFSSESHAMGQTAINYTLRNSLGVVACIAPWNLPLYLLSWKIAPALAMGNTVVAKPSEITPMTAFLLSQVCIDVGLPPGVLNIVHGLGTKVGRPLVQASQVAAVSFTGSTKTGAEIASLTAPLFKKVSLEMGGKNPNIIFSDADFDAAIDGTLKSSFSNQGQICLCGSRVYVERSLYPKFRAALLEKVAQLRVGDPLESSVDQGAVVSEAHFQKVMSYIEIAKQEGGTVIAGGMKVKLQGRCENGWFIAPTIIEGLGPQSRVNQEEVFGPVITLAPFDREEEVLEWANSTRYGLAASLWTNNLTRAHRFAAQLRAGIVWVNTWMLRDLRTPFGGVKDSGVGREGGVEVLRFFTEPKNVCIQLN